MSETTSYPTFSKREWIDDPERCAKASDPETQVRVLHPERYASIARLVDVSMWHDEKPCRGGRCDEDRCPRHERFDARRYVRLVDRWKKLRSESAEGES
jgi:hypothetical protein